MTQSATARAAGNPPSPPGTTPRRTRHLSTTPHLPDPLRPHPTTPPRHRRRGTARPVAGLLLLRARRTRDRPRSTTPSRLQSHLPRWNQRHAWNPVALTPVEPADDDQLRNIEPDAIVRATLHAIAHEPTLPLPRDARCCAVHLLRSTDLPCTALAQRLGTRPRTVQRDLHTPPCPSLDFAIRLRLTVRQTLVRAFLGRGGAG